MIDSQEAGEPTAGRHVAHVDLYWLPLGAGGSRLVRRSGRLFEAVQARRQGRRPCDLYHSGLDVSAGTGRYTIEMAPIWQHTCADRGVVAEGPVGSTWLGRSRFFRYEIRRWRNGAIPDLAEAVGGPRRLSAESIRAQRLLDLVPMFPTATWGRDDLRTGDMWNSNSLVAWLLARSGHRTELVEPPVHGRAPGWSAGLLVARREIAAQRALLS